MRQELFDHGFQDETPTRIDAALNDAYYDVCSREPWPFLEARTTLTTTAAQDTITGFPADFRAAITLTIPSASQALEPRRLDDFQKRFAGQETNSGTPYVYYFIGSTMHLWPVPDSTYTMTLNYIKTPTALSALTDTPIVPVQHHRVIVLGALVTLYNMEDDPDLAAVFKQQFEQRLQTMREDAWKRQYDRPDRIYDVFGYDDYFIW